MRSIHIRFNRSDADALKKLIEDAILKAIALAALAPEDSSWDEVRDNLPQLARTLNQLKTQPLEAGFEVDEADYATFLFGIGETRGFIPIPTPER
jgi:hypothetical protein